MRFEHLSVPAYGPFTGFELRLPTGGRDFHLIYGPNEAGKSSLLRAIRDLLYGIHGQTDDNFLHDYRSLRIAGAVAAADGRWLRFQRRKGNKDTLLDSDGQPLPDDSLAPFLGRVDRDFFTTLFGLGAEELRAGAEALLQGRGEVGQALFSASLAGTPVHRTLDALEGEARAILNGRARRGVRLRPALEAYHGELRRSREASVRPEQWQTVLRSLEQAQAEREQLDARLEAQRQRRDWLQRCLDALPSIGELRERERQRAALATLPVLGPEFVSDTNEALERRAATRETLAQARTRLQQIERRIAENRPAPEVLTRAGAIERVHQQLPIYRQWREEAAALESERALVEAELQTGMRELGVAGGRVPDDGADARQPAAAHPVEALRAAAADVLALRAAADALERAVAAVQSNTDEQRRVAQALAKNEANEQALAAVDPAPLEAALARTEAAAEAERSLAERETAHAEARTALEDARALLRPQPADAEGTAEGLAALFALPVPAAATLRRFESELAEVDDRRAAVQQALADSGGRITRLELQLAQLTRRGELPSRAGLEQARRHRDQAWARVRAAWQQGAEAGELDGRPLAEAYPLTVQAADRIADRLRDQADAVAQAEGLELQLQEARQSQADGEAELQRLEAARQDWQGRWRGLWSPCRIEPLTPAEMLDWRDRWAEFHGRYQGWRSAEQVLSGARAAIDRAVALLRPLLPECPDDALLRLREAAAAKVNAAARAEGRRETLRAQAAEQRSEREALARERPALDRALVEAQADWDARCAALGLPAEAGTGAVRTLLERRQALVERLDLRDRLDRQMDGKQQSIAAYEGEVHALADALALPAGLIEVREGALWEALEQARGRRARASQAEQDRIEAQEAVERAQQALQRLEHQVEAARARAECDDEAGLERLLHALEQRHGLDAQIERLRQGLHGAARGEPLDAFIDRVAAEPADRLAAERDGLDQEFPGLQAQRDRAVRRLVEVEADKHALEQAGEAAADARQAAENRAAAIRQDAARYLRLRLAIHFLREQIERYRRENQGPLLERASRLFTAVTGGSFEGLATAYSGDDAPILVGLRSGAEVPVAGMSEGTRDQLYLALRLAAIERHQQHHEPMPVILDDLLVTFDDARASAVLSLLAELGGRTQVLLFSHHRHLIELARATLPADAVHHHALGPG